MLGERFECPETLSAARQRRLPLGELVLSSVLRCDRERQRSAEENP